MIRKPIAASISTMYLGMPAGGAGAAGGGGAAGG